MGRGAQADDKEAMAPKLPSVVALVVLCGLAIASPAAARQGPQLAQQVVAAAPHPATVAKAPGGLIAPPSACPGQGKIDAPAEAQELAMRCMTDFARRQLGLSELTPTAALEQSAGDKSEDVLSCDEFSHFACGREFAYWMRETGYTSTPCWRVGENLAFGTYGYGSVRAIFEAWMRSPGHRENILGDFAEIGVSLRVGALEGEPGTRIWAQHFGSHC